MSESRLITASAYLPSAKAPPLTQFHLESKREVRRMDMDGPLFEKRIQTAGAAPTEVLFGPFRLLPTQFLLVEGSKPH